MGKNTEISWCHHTFNPWWGCQRVSPGCERCYAETFSKRVGLKVWGPQAPRRFFGEKHWDEPFKWNRDAEKAGERRRVFCASMADVFEDRRDLDPWRDRLWSLIDATPALDWLLLTKRPESMPRLAPARWAQRWPANVWAGATVEDQQRAEERIPHLIRVPATVRFLSGEPLLGPLDLSKWIRPIDHCEACNGENQPQGKDVCPACKSTLGLTRTWGEEQAQRMRDGSRYADGGPGESGDGPQIHWSIVGGESGPGARPFILCWALDIVRACQSAGVSVFVKQLGAKPYEFVAGPPIREGSLRQRIRLVDPKGGDVSEWPWRSLRVREFPEVAR